MDAETEYLQVLYNRYWNDIIPLAEKYNIEPWKLVRIEEKSKDHLNLWRHPIFLYYTNTAKYSIQFAVTVIENVPVFQDDKLFNKDGIDVRMYAVDEDDNAYVYIRNDCKDEIKVIPVSELSFKEPKKVVELTNKEIRIISYNLITHPDQMKATSTEYSNIIQDILNKLGK